MVSYLEIPSYRERVFRIPVKTYYRMEADVDSNKRTELIRGVIFEKIPPSPLHYSIAKRLHTVLLANVPAGFDVRMEGPLTLQDSVPIPDLAVVHGSANDFEEQHPVTAALVVEVAISNYSDAFNKAELYAEAGVQEFWIVRPKERCVEIHTEPSAGGYLACQTKHAPELLTCSQVSGVVLDLAALFERSSE